MAISKRLSLAHQENILSLLAHSDDYGKIVADLVDASLFEGDYRDIAEGLIEYWRQHKQAPKAHSHDLFANVLEAPGNRRAATYRSILSSMLTLSEDINASFVIDELAKFTRVQRLKVAIVEAAERLQSPTPTTIEDVEGMLSDILRARDLRLDEGMRLSDVDRLIDYLSAQHSEFSTGVAQLDLASVVPYRGAVYMLLGGKGTGKSWWLVNLGKRSVIRRKKVVHITLENSEELTLQRYWQALYALPQREAEVRQTTKFRMERSKSGGSQLASFVKEEPPFEFAFDSDDLKQELDSRVIGSRFDDYLIIKGFPSGRLTMPILEGYLDSLDQIAQFTPDIVLLDYIGLTHVDPKDKRGSLGKNMVDFRALCIDRDIAGATVHQINRKGIGAKQARSTHAAEDISLIHTADTCLTHSATDMEQKNGLARLFVDHARTARDKFGVLITQNYSIGQYVLDSIPLPDSYFDYLAMLEPEQDDDDDEDEDQD